MVALATTSPSSLSNSSQLSMVYVSCLRGCLWHPCWIFKVWAASVALNVRWQWNFLLGVCRDRPAYECAGRSLNVLPRLCLIGEQIENSRLLSDKPGLLLQMVI
ncbi:Uncharacterized protein ALO76_04673 [Pseudomonas syringae pv. coriandricola]|nr:Uncharacterized protein ALO76_04673 [Pseudomonas syringae pv. coriandricola]